MSLIAMIALLSAPAIAADERRLSDEEVQAILDKAALKRAAPVAKAPAPARPIEGEIGVSIGTGGTYEAFGTAVIPVGAEGLAIISIDGGEPRRDYLRRR